MQQSVWFSSSRVWVWELDHKEGWALKNWCFWPVILEKTLESPLDCKEIKPVIPKRNQSWIFIGRTDAKAETPVLWSPDAKNWLTGKDPDAGKEWRQEEKGTIEDEMAGWHHWLNGHEFEQAVGDGGGQGSPMDTLQSLVPQRVGHDWETEQQAVSNQYANLVVLSVFSWNGPGRTGVRESWSGIPPREDVHLGKWKDCHHTLPGS